MVTTQGRKTEAQSEQLPSVLVPSPALKNKVGGKIGGRRVDDELKNEALAGDELDKTGTSRR